jgi:hypothetical protein
MRADSYVIKSGEMLQKKLGYQEKNNCFLVMFRLTVLLQHVREIINSQTSDCEQTEFRRLVGSMNPVGFVTLRIITNSDDVVSRLR